MGRWAAGKSRAAKNKRMNLRGRAPSGLLPLGNGEVTASLERDRTPSGGGRTAGEVTDNTGVPQRAPRRGRCYCVTPVISNLAVDQNHPRKFWKKENMSGEFT